MAFARRGGCRCPIMLCCMQTRDTTPLGSALMYSRLGRSKRYQMRRTKTCADDTSGWSCALASPVDLTGLPQAHDWIQPATPGETPSAAQDHEQQLGDHGDDSEHEEHASPGLLEATSPDVPAPPLLRRGEEFASTCLRNHSKPMTFEGPLAKTLKTSG